LLACFRRFCILAAGLALTGGGHAFAHSSFEGAEGVYQGLSHPIQEPAQALLSVALGILIGRLEPKRMGLIWITLGMVMALGALVAAGLGLAAQGLPLAVMHGALLIVGISLAVRNRPAMALTLPAVFAGGMVMGMNALSQGADGQLETTGGSILGALILTVYLVSATYALATQERRLPGLRLVPRVAGAWACAIAMLTLALSLSEVA